MKYIKVPVKKEIYSDLYLAVSDDFDEKAIIRYEYNKLIEDACSECDDTFAYVSDYDAEISADGSGELVSEDELSDYSHYIVKDTDKYPKIGPKL